MDIVDLTDGEKYRVVTINEEGLLTLSALHMGVLERGKAALAEEVAEKMAKAKNFNDVQEIMVSMKKSLDGAEAISELLMGMVKQMKRNNITTSVRMLFTKPEMDYFLKLASLPVDLDKAFAVGVSEELVQKAKDAIASVQTALDNSESPNENDIKALMSNNNLAAATSGNIFNPPIGKA